MQRKRKRKTVAERRAERAEAESREWAIFREKVLAANSFGDALLIVRAAPRESAPGRRYYSNLGFFLQAFTVPGSSDSDERHLYLGLIRRIAAAEGLKPGVLERVEHDLGGS